MAAEGGSRLLTRQCHGGIVSGVQARRMSRSSESRESFAPQRRETLPIVSRVSLGKQRRGSARSRPSTGPTRQILPYEPAGLRYTPHRGMIEGYGIRWCGRGHAPERAGMRPAAPAQWRDRFRQGSPTAALALRAHVGGEK